MDREDLQPDIDHPLIEQEDEVAKLSTEVAYFNAEHDYRNLRIKRLEQQLRLETIRRVYMRARLEEEHAELERIRNEFRRIEATTAWRLTRRYWEFNMRWLPFGSWRRTAYNRLTSLAARFLRLAGPPHRIKSKPEPNVHESLVRCESPSPGDLCGGVIPVRGRAVNSTRIEHVEI